MKTGLLVIVSLWVLNLNAVNVLSKETTQYTAVNLAAYRTSRIKCIDLRGGRPSENFMHTFVGENGKTVANVNDDGEIVGSTVPWIDALIKKKNAVHLSELSSLKC